MASERPGATEMATTALVTRPAAQAGAWVERLRAAGFPARALPLLAIDPVADPSALRSAWTSLGDCALAMFVSPNAVQGFFAARPPRASWPAALRAAAVGPGTVQALVAAGVPAARCVAPQAPPFDSGQLWTLLQDESWRGRRVLIVRGDGGRDEFAQALRGAGAEVAFVQAYARARPRWHPEEAALAARALETPGEFVWLLSSAEAAGHLPALLPGADWSRAIAIASHPRIAAAARHLGFGRVMEAAPTTPAIVDALRTIGAGD